MQKIKAVSVNEKLEPVRVADVMRRMKAEYAQTGVYKSNDLKMILGNPKTGVGFTSASYTVGSNNKLNKK